MILRDPLRCSNSPRSHLQSASLDVPVGKVPLLPPSSRPLTPRRLPLPRPRVFIRQPPRPSSLDVAAVVSATGPDGADQRCLITRPVARSSSRAFTPPSSIAVTPRSVTGSASAWNCTVSESSPHSDSIATRTPGDHGQERRVLSSRSNAAVVEEDDDSSLSKIGNRATSRRKLPPAPPPPRPSRRRLSPDVYFSDDDAEEGDRPTGSRRVRSLRSLRPRRASTSAVTADDLSYACFSPRSSGPLSPASAPPSTVHVVVDRNSESLEDNLRMPSDPCLRLASSVADRPRPPIANASPVTPAIERYSCVQGVQVVAANDSGDALSRVRRAVSALRSLSFQNGCSEDLDTAWGQATASGDNTDNAFLRKDRLSPCVHCSDAHDPRTASCNHPDVRISQTGRKWRRPKGRVSSRALRSTHDDAGTDVDGDTDIDEDLSEPGLNNGRALGITRGLGLSVRRASERVERELGNDTDGEDTVWPDGSAPSHAAQRRGRLSAVYAAVPWNRPGRRSSPGPPHAYGMAHFGLASNAVFGHAAPRNARFSPSTSTRRPPSTRAHVHGAGHVPAWQRKSLWSNGSGRRGTSCGCATAATEGGNGSSTNGGGCVCGGCACCSTPGGAAEAAARLLLAGGGHALLAASTSTGFEGADGMQRSSSRSNHAQKGQHGADHSHAGDNSKPNSQSEVDKYVEFIHASAAREVSARRTLVRNKVVNRAQAVFRRRRK